MNSSNTFYLTHYSENIIISTGNQSKTLGDIFQNLVCIFTLIAFATFLGLNSHTWLEATVLNNTVAQDSIF